MTTKIDFLTKSPINALYISEQSEATVHTIKWELTLIAIRRNKPILEYVSNLIPNDEGNINRTIQSNEFRVKCDFKIGDIQIDWILSVNRWQCKYQNSYDDYIKLKVIHKRLTIKLFERGISNCSDCQNMIDYKGVTNLPTACECRHNEWSTFHSQYDDDIFQKFTGTYGRRDTYIGTEGMKYTFGVEFETSDGYLPRHVRKLINAKCVRDGSVRGGEYVTGTPLKGDKGIESLGFIIDQLNANDHKVDSRCGLHVHIGGANFNRKFSALAIRLSYQLQDILFQMQPQSRQSNHYCPKMPAKWKSTNFKNGNNRIAEYVHNSSELNSRNNKKRDLGRYPSARYKWMNLTRCNSLVPQGQETIEFRLHAGTLNKEKTIKWVKICMSIVNFIENNQRRILKNQVSLSEVIHYALPNQHEEIISYINKRITKFSGEKNKIRSRGAKFGYGVHRFNGNLSHYLMKQEKGLSTDDIQKLEWDKMKEKLQALKLKRKQFNLSIIPTEGGELTHTNL